MTLARKGSRYAGTETSTLYLPDYFLQAAGDTVHRRTASVQAVQRFRLVLLLYEQPSLGSDAAAMQVGR